MKTVLITGASSGIGAAYAESLAKRGHDLVLVARRAQRLEEVAHGARARGVRVETLTADLSIRVGQALAEARLEKGVWGLVNNAGFGLHGSFGAQSREALDEMIQLNVTAPIRLAHAALPSMIAAGSGWIANVASGMAFRPSPESAVYSATKAFIMTFSECLSATAEGRIYVQTIVPGVTRTEFSQRYAIDYSKIPAERQMETADFVAAALRGFDLRERVTVPSMEDPEVYDNFLRARALVGENVSNQTPASRYSKS